MSGVLARHPLVRRGLVTLCLILVFIAGRYIPLPNIALGSYLERQPFLHTSLTALGGDLSQIGLFSLGLGPMMSSMILSQLFLMGQKRQLSPKVLDRRKNLLLLVIAFIQGMGVAVNLTYLGSGSLLVNALATSLILMAGAMVLSWLANMNGAYGIGGPVLITLTSILLGQLQVLPLVRDLIEEGEGLIVLGFMAWALLTIFFFVLFDRSEYRVPIQRLSIHNQYAQDSYLPFKLNVTNGMPLMYAHSLLTFPQYLVMFIGYFFPKWSLGQKFLPYLTTSHAIGIVAYLLIIALLCLLLAFVTADVVQLTESMRNTGDYIPFIRPGQPTKAYLSRLVRRLAAFNACYLMVLAGVPLLVSLGDKSLQPLANLMGGLMMLSGMSLSITDELLVMNLKKRYKSLFG